MVDADRGGAAFLPGSRAAARAMAAPPRIRPGLPAGRFLTVSAVFCLSGSPNEYGISWDSRGPVYGLPGRAGRWGMGPTGPRSGEGPPTGC